MAMETLIELLYQKQFDEARKLILADRSLLSSTNAVPELHPGMALTHYYAFYGDEAELRFLLDQGADVNQISANGSTPLHHASGSGLESTVRLLLARGANPNAQDALGKTPLHWVATGNIMSHQLHYFLDTITALIHHGADLTTRDKSGKTPSDLAQIQVGHPRLRKLLEYT